LTDGTGEEQEETFNSENEFYDDFEDNDFDAGLGLDASDEPEGTTTVAVDAQVQQQQPATQALTRDQRALGSSAGDQRRVTRVIKTESEIFKKCKSGRQSSGPWRHWACPDPD